MPPVLPNFELAPCLGASPGCLLRSKNDEVGKLLLALALAYNDLKGAFYLNAQLSQYRESHGLSHLSPAQSGQYGGMGDQVIRLIAGILHETLVVIYDRKKVLRDPEVKAIVGDLPADSRASWEAVVRIALSKDTADDRKNPIFRTMLMLRNRLAFHYCTKSLGSGYQAFFDVSAADINRTRAVFSSGQDMESTRFYFADAAALGAVEEAVGTSRDEAHERVAKLARYVNGGLRGIVLAFITKRSGGDIRTYP